jgi:glycine cleavage system H protein
MSETKIPDHLVYSESHEWRQQHSDVTTLGITDFAQAELGEIVFVELPEIGEHIEKGEAFGTVEAVKTVADLLAPVSGEVLETNESLEEGAEHVNKDAYGAGWMIKIRIDDPDDFQHLLGPEEYAELLANH